MNRTRGKCQVGVDPAVRPARKETFSPLAPRRLLDNMLEKSNKCQYCRRIDDNAAICLVPRRDWDQTV
jgi:hypothetical protein